MLLTDSGHAIALPRLVGAKHNRGPDFLGLADAFSTLHPHGSQGKHLLDSTLLANPK